MKKKITILTLAIMLLATGVVSAAANWGKFEGYNIVKLVINGKTVAVEDTPPVILKGRTMVPLSMLSEAGVNATWDKDTYTVNVTTSSTGTSKSKHYASLAYYYGELDDLGVSISNLANLFEVVYNRYTQGTDQNFTIDRAYEDLNNQINRYNDRISIVDMIIKAGYNVNDTRADSNRIMEDYFDALEYFKKSIAALDEIANYGNSSVRYNTYFNNAEEGMSIANQASLDSYNLYHKYIELAMK